MSPWRWLSEKKNKATLAFIGTGVVAAISLVMKVFFLHAEPSVSASAPNGIAIVGSTVSNPVVNNNYAAPDLPPQITWSSTPENSGVGLFNPRLAKNPGVRVEIALLGPFRFPFFVIDCDRPCKVIEMVTEGVVMFQPYDSDVPTTTAAGFTTPTDLVKGSRVSIDVRSQDGNSVKVLAVHPEAHPQ